MCQLGIRHSDWALSGSDERCRSAESARLPGGEEMHDGILNKVSADCVTVKLSRQLNCSTNDLVCVCLLKFMVTVISHRIRTNIYMGRCFETPTGDT